MIDLQVMYYSTRDKYNHQGIFENQDSYNLTVRLLVVGPVLNGYIYDFF